VGIVKRVTAGVKAVQPVADAIRTADHIGEGGHLAILPGDPEATRRLRELLGNPAAAPDEDALVILAVTAGTDLGPGAAALERARQRHPECALAVLVGTRQERAELERALLAGHRLEPSNVVHVDSLEGPNAEVVVDRIIDMLGEEAVETGRRNPALRPAVGRRIVRGAARQAAGVGALPLGGAAMPVLTLQQIRMVGKLATLHDRPFGAERSLSALAILGAGFGWRALGRSAASLIPGAGWALSGGIAYGITRGLGEATRARLEAGHELIEGKPIEVLKPKLDPLLDRLRGRS
jgi:uncharacterized protein (DUF697 family)